LGYVTLAPALNEGATADHDSLHIAARVWLLAQGARFADVRMLTAASRSDSVVERSDGSNWPVPEQVGSQQSVVLGLPLGVTRLAVCLSMKTGRGREPYRVTQQFTIHGAPTEGEQPSIAPIGEATVSRERGDPCNPSKSAP
jgi:hypothetical protein